MVIVVEDYNIVAQRDNNCNVSLLSGLAVSKPQLFPVSSSFRPGLELATATKHRREGGRETFPSYFTPPPLVISRLCAVDTKNESRSVEDEQTIPSRRSAQLENHTITKKIQYFVIAHTYLNLQVAQVVGTCTVCTYPRKHNMEDRYLINNLFHLGDFRCSCGTVKKIKCEWYCILL